MWLALVAAVTLFALPDVVLADKRPTGLAMDAVRAGNWTSAFEQAAEDGANAVAVVEWHLLRSGRGTPERVFAFLERFADWPGLPYLRQQSEGTMAQAQRADILRFFAGQLPRTGTGVLAFAQALRDSDQPAAADAELIRGWTTLTLSDVERRRFLDAHANLLAPHHQARVDEMLWLGKATQARAILPLIAPSEAALAEARIALISDSGGLDARIAALSADQQTDPGLAYARFDWRMDKGRWPDATELIATQSSSPAKLGRPEAWARHRVTLARDAMRDGAAPRAYALAANHHLADLGKFAELEWLAGYVALTQLDDPVRAIPHFERFSRAVETPISLARAGYWLGRAYEAAGQSEAASTAYAVGAQFQTAFYGLLAAERAGLDVDPTLAGSEPFPDWAEAPFLQSTVFDAAILLLAGGEVSLAERFFTHLSETLDRTQIGQMGALLEDLGQPHIQVMLGKRAARYGMQVPGPYYALHPLADRAHPVPPEMVLSIARRESEFDPIVVSPVGARGMMQLMPGTAREMARKEGLPYSARRLLTDPDYNVTLGSAYLGELAERFGGNPVLVAAAYNAGPSRPDRWMRQYGDPRRGDVIDWIERIPFDETRNYVMRVTESLPVYRARLGLDPLPRPFSQELQGSGLLAGTP